jgi:hypothetical protein
MFFEGFQIVGELEDGDFLGAVIAHVDKKLAPVKARGCPFIAERNSQLPSKATRSNRCCTQK